MTRPRNRIATKSLQISGNEILERKLDQAIDTGLFGKNRAEAAERLIAQGWLALCERGLLDESGNEVDRQ